MPTIESLIRDDLSAAIDVIGEAIEYRAPDGLARDVAPWKTINAVVDRDVEPQGSTSQPGREQILVEVGYGSIDPPRLDRDQVRVDGKVYRVVRTLVRDGATWILHCI